MNEEERDRIRREVRKTRVSKRWRQVVSWRHDGSTALKLDTWRVKKTHGEQGFGQEAPKISSEYAASAEDPSSARRGAGQ